ncbi:MAG TPA: Sapep family Mn(2+)-dependent dipeptidase [Firmicutes bacterium]|nr:Sapep family Mn(2+)-dependent dipeptidase [Candidatus Fermentithermobacillaceae bacterium]
MNEKEFAAYLDAWLEPKRDEIVDCLVRLIRIPSVGTEPVDGKPFGEEVDRALRFVVDEAGRFGMKTKNVDGYAVHAEIGSGDEMVMALTHVDVVPIGSGWTKDPLGEVAGGFVYGRGAQDNKGPTVACLYALRALKESGVPLKRRVRHVVGGNEESGFRCVRHYFEVEEKPTYGFSPDAMFPLVYAEKGSMNILVTVDFGEPVGASETDGHTGPVASLEHFEGGERPNIVGEKAEAVLRVRKGREDEVISSLESAIPKAKEFAGGPGPLEFKFEKGEGTVKVESKGKAAHASVPEEGTNAIAALLYLLGTLGPRLVASEGIAFAAQAAAIHGEGLNIRCEDDISGLLTCNLGVARLERTGSHRTLRCIYNIRFPVRASGEELRQRALSCDHPGGAQIEVMSVGKPHYTDPESFLVKTLLRIYREETGDNSPPMAIGGGTYAKVIPGGVAYGPVRPGEVETAHQADERISVDELMFLVKIYARALFALAVS